MNYEKVKNQFGTWAPLFKEFIESKEFDDIFIALKKEAAKGNRIAPHHTDVFKAFYGCDKDKIKIIICGLAPYHTFEDDICVADGYALGCSKTVKKKGLQPSLKLVYNELERVYGGKMEKSNSDYGNVECWAKQGVLMYNVALTTTEGKPGNHVQLWENFNRYFWETVIGQYNRGICCIFLGEVAQKSMKYLNPMQHYLFPLMHPAANARNDQEWSSDGVFRKIDKILKDNNNEGIWWLLDLPF